MAPGLGMHAWPHRSTTLAGLSPALGRIRQPARPLSLRFGSALRCFAAPLRRLGLALGPPPGRVLHPLGRPARLGRNLLGLDHRRAGAQVRQPLVH
jgi:hypothetical protein